MHLWPLLCCAVYLAIFFNGCSGMGPCAGLYIAMCCSGFLMTNIVACMLT